MGVDPYLTSPSMAHFGVHGSAQGVPDAVVHAAPPPGLRGVDQTIPGSGPEALAERLSNKRRATRQALAPFGRSDKGLEVENSRRTSEAGTPSATTAATPLPSTFVEDDPDEELQTAETAPSVSPGLTRME